VYKAEVSARRQQFGDLFNFHDHVAQLDTLAHLGHPGAVEDRAAVAAARDDDAQFTDHRLASVSAR
jgi:hypothetical protein